MAIDDGIQFYQKFRSWRWLSMVIFHTLVVITYGYSIYWQEFSDVSTPLYYITNPSMRPYGRWRLLTFQCLVLQFVTYVLCLLAQFAPRLNRSKDYIFTSLAIPIGMLVVVTFWSVWNIAGRESIAPRSLEEYYKPWLNHVTHSLPVPINLIELVLIRHEYQSDKRSLGLLSGFMLLYILLTLYIRHDTGKFVYIFLNYTATIPMTVLFVGMILFAMASYKMARIFHDYFHDRFGSYMNDESDSDIMEIPYTIDQAESRINSVKTSYPNPLHTHSSSRIETIEIA